MWVDQPVGTGFSYANTDYIHNEAQVSQEMAAFLTAFFQQYPQYASLDFFVTGESYVCSQHRGKRLTQLTGGTLRSCCGELHCAEWTKHQLQRSGHWWWVSTWISLLCDLTSLTAGLVQLFNTVPMDRLRTRTISLRKSSIRAWTHPMWNAKLCWKSKSGRAHSLSAAE